MAFNHHNSGFDKVIRFFGYKREEREIADQGTIEQEEIKVEIKRFSYSTKEVIPIKKSKLIFRFDLFFY